MPDQVVRGMQHVEIGSADLERSADFYGGLLGFPEVPAPGGAPASTRCFAAGAVSFQLTGVGGAADPGGWVNSDVQAGIRHVGMKVHDVDRAVERLQGAGVRVLSPPADVLGGVRIAFFLDPDGTRLEFVQGDLQYQHVVSPALVAAEAAATMRPGQAARFDHVGLTVDDLPAAMRFYGEGLGWTEIGSIRHHDDERGFLMTYLSAGQAVLEVFSFDVPTTPNPWEPSAALSGVRSVGVAGALPPDAVAALGGRVVDPVPGVRADVVAPDGSPLTWVERS